MKQIMIEYAGAGLAILGTVTLFELLGTFFLRNEGIFATFISMTLERL